MAEDSRIEIPTTKELKTLPCWARVAFAARCARRVQPLFRAAWPQAAKEHIETVDTAVTAAERSAASGDPYAVGARVPPSFTAVADATAAAADAARYALCAAYSVVVAEMKRAQAGANAAIQAANKPSAAADRADEALEVDDADNVVADAAACAAQAVDAAAASHAEGAAYVRAYSVVRAAMHRDFELLKEAAVREEWTDDTPVAPEFFGPLWPQGVPAGWPVSEEGSEGSELVFEIDVPDDADDEAMYAKAMELAGRADELHRAYGGRGLKVKSVEVYDEAHVREGVPS